MSAIEMVNLQKTFKVLKHHEGLKGAFIDLVSHDYKSIKAVDGISMTIEKGEIIGYIGRNGAGKSTTIKMMTGVLQPTEGTILVNGFVPYKNKSRNNQNIGVVFGQRTQLWWALPVIESFKILKEIYRIEDKAYKENLELFDELVNISSLYSKPVRQMSLGQRTLCDILAAFLHNPSIVFLDEPTIGLDVSIKAQIRNLIKELNRRKNTTIILTTHDIGDVEALCQRVIIIDEGRIIFDNPFEKLKEMFGAFRTLKINIPDLNEEKYNQICLDIQGKFLGTSIEFENQKDEWMDITINQEEIVLPDLLNFVMKQYPVKDIQLEEVSTEMVIRRIYEGDIK